MKTLVIYYSFTGKTKKIAEDLASKQKADIIELKEIKKRSKFSAMFFGSMASRKHKKANLQSFNTDFKKYTKIIIAMPIWAGNPAPPLNTLLEFIPSDKEIELLITSGSGDSKNTKQRLEQIITGKGSKLTTYKDIKTS